MKKLVLILLFTNQFSLIAYSQDTSITNYFPMNVGNVWVYHCYSAAPWCYCNMHFRYKITGSQVINGQRYFLYQYSQIIISCGGVCNSMYITLDTVRIDSVSGNVLKYSQPGCSYSPNEIMQDSLRARINDTVGALCITNNEYPYRCADTSNVTIFGYSRQSKTFLQEGFESGWERQYVKGFGISYFWYIQPACSWGSTLRGCVINGVVYGDTTFIVGINRIGTEIPEEFALYQNYPNPFNPVTKIRFSLPRPSKEGETLVRLVVYDVLGEEIATLFSSPLGRVGGATYEVEWDGTNYPSGVYYYKLESGDFSQTKKLVLVK
jgi:hypothetical protein